LNINAYAAPDFYQLNTTAYLAGRAQAASLAIMRLMTILRPPGLLRGNDKRPDGTTLIPLSGGRPMLWDFTCSDTLAPSHLSKISVLAGAAAVETQVKKNTKYSNFIHWHIFIPVAIETLGLWGPRYIELVDALASRLLEASQDPRSQFILRQRIDIVVQRGNAVNGQNSPHEQRLTSNNVYFVLFFMFVGF